MIFRNGHKIKRIVYNGHEIHRGYFEEQVVFKRFHPVRAVVAQTTEQYVATDMKDFWTDELDYEIGFAGNLNSSCIFGCRPDKSYQEYSIILTNPSGGRVEMRKGGQTVNGSAPTYYTFTGSIVGNAGSINANLLGCDRGDKNAMQIYDISRYHVLKKVKNEVYLDGQLGTINNSASNDFFLTYLPPFFFKLNQKDFQQTEDAVPNSPNANGTRYIYYATFFKNGKVYRDYVPALDENNIPALYDKVTNTFWYSSGEKPLQYFEGIYGQASCLSNFEVSRYINSEILPENIGKWELRIQSSIVSSTNSAIVATNNKGFGSGRSDKSGIYFYLLNGNYVLQIGDQNIVTTVPFFTDSEIKIKFDLINKKVTIEQNQQQTLENQATYTYDITTTDDLTNLPEITIGKINGLANSATTYLRLYGSKIYDKSGKLIQYISPRVNLETSKSAPYDEVSKKPCTVVGEGISYI